MDRDSASVGIRADHIAKRSHLTPEGLIETLFADCPAVYAILDGNRIAHLPELLETSDLPHQCLFQDGMASGAIAEAAPWLVMLAPDARLTRQLMLSAALQTGPVGYWDRHPGIYLQSGLDIDALRRHFRRFLRVQDQRGTAYFFRFWEAEMAQVYFAALATQPRQIERWFKPREGGQIDAVLVPDPAAVSDDAPPSFHSFRPFGLPRLAMPPKGAFSIRDEDLQRFRQVLNNRDITLILDRVRDNFPELSARTHDAGFDRWARRFLSRMMDCGFFQKANLLTLLVWELFYGPDFVTRDPSGQLSALLHGNADETERFEQMKDLIDDLNLPENPA